MTSQPSKPDGETKPVDDRQAVDQQGSTKPSDYPESDRAAGEHVIERKN